MKTESNIRPTNTFEIENIINGKCDIVFYDNVVTEEEKYIYDIYRIGVNYRDNLEEDLNDEQKYQQWIELAKKTEYDKLATEIRAKRDKLLADTDKYMLIDRMSLNLTEINGATLLSNVRNFFETLKNMSNGDIAKYRQKLRDITTQAGFPYNVEFPKEPNTDNNEEEV